MSTVKDMISSYAIKGIIFPPRLIALLVFLLVVFLANKFFAPGPVSLELCRILFSNQIATQRIKEKFTDKTN